MNRIGRSGHFGLSWADTGAASRTPERQKKSRRNMRRSNGVTRQDLPASSMPARGKSHERLLNLLSLAQAFDQGRAQQKFAREFRVFRRASELVMIAPAHRRVAFRQQPLVAYGLRLGVLDGDVTALAFITVEHVLFSLAA